MKRRTEVTQFLRRRKRQKRLDALTLKRMGIVADHSVKGLRKNPVVIHIMKGDEPLDERTVKALHEMCCKAYEQLAVREVMSDGR